jgi:MoxR-like ATPase
VRGDVGKTVRAGRPLVDFVKLCYKARRPPLLVGRHGVGKSELLEQAARELDIRYIVRDLSLMEPPDLVGLPVLDGKVTRYLPPAFLPVEGKGLLVFEELNRCPSYMRGPTLQLLTARTLNDYTLPPGWLPAAAVNPSGSEYDVEELDPALLSRFARVTVVADPREWLAWAETAGVHRDVLAYVRYDPKVFNDGDWSNPRAWHYVSDLLHAAARGGADADSLEVALAGTVGAERAAAFRTFRKTKAELPSAMDLLTAYSTYRTEVKGWAAAGQTDKLSALAYLVKVHVQNPDNYTTLRENRRSWKNLGNFLSDLPPDLAASVREFLAERGYEDLPRRIERAKP